MQKNASLGLVIAQRRVPQSLWHRGLNAAYKEAKELGRNRVAVRVLFNSGQSLSWVCPWPLWDLLINVELAASDQTQLNRWEKLLSYLESTRLQQSSPYMVGKLMDALWASVGIRLTWEEVNKVSKDFRKEIGEWPWWINWVSLMAFIARQEREREKWVEKLIAGDKAVFKLM